jgi:fatty-acyl-CoA synthase
MRGYDADDAATAAAIDAQGWLRTGDLAAMRSDGYLSIKGRVTDMIIRGGENIYPKEVEDVVSSHPKVADCCVVGIPDEHFGEAVTAWVRVKGGCELDSDELMAFCQRRIARYKTPSDIRWVQEFPLTSNGKIDRKRIRQIEVEARELQHLSELRTA